MVDGWWAMTTTILTGGRKSVSVEIGLGIPRSARPLGVQALRKKRPHQPEGLIEPATLQAFGGDVI
jgi:hypothetical protein